MLSWRLRWVLFLVIGIIICKFLAFWGPVVKLWKALCLFLFFYWILHNTTHKVKAYPLLTKQILCVCSALSRDLCGQHTRLVKINLYKNSWAAFAVDYAWNKFQVCSVLIQMHKTFRKFIHTFFNCGCMWTYAACTIATNRSLFWLRTQELTGETLLSSLHGHADCFFDFLESKVTYNSINYMLTFRLLPLCGSSHWSTLAPSSGRTPNLCIWTCMFCTFLHFQTLESRSRMADRDILN